MKSTFSGLQFCRWQYGSISIRLAVVAFQMYEIARNSKKIRTSQRYRGNQSPNHQFFFIVDHESLFQNINSMP